MIRPRSVGVIRFAGLGRRGADHENDDEGAAFCGAQIGASGKGRFDRGMEAVSAARARAMEIAQHCAALPRLTPTASHRRRLARLRASEL